MNSDIIFEIKPKHVFYVRFFSINLFFALIMSFFPCMILDMLQAVLGFNFLYWLLFNSIFFILFVLLLVFLDKKNFEATSYKVYSDKIEFEEGFINHKYTTIKMKDIKEIHFTQNFFQRLANIGTIKLITAANNSSNFTGLKFVDVENSNEIYTKIKQVHQNKN